MKKILLFLFPILLFSCKSTTGSSLTEKQKIGTILNYWHKAAANAQFEAYFNLMTDNAVFIGTDPTENWTKVAFKNYAKPYFDKGKAWDFSAIKRNIYLSKDQKTAWFDELLDTQMKLCRGSGIVIKENGRWKIVHYVLSIAIPNDNTNEVVKIKTPFDDNLLLKMKSEK